MGCVSGGDPGGNDSGPECYSNSDCSGGHECSMGVCVGFVGGCVANPTRCRNNENCLDDVCRLTCDNTSECSDQGLICGTDTQHCKPGQNPTRPQSQPQSGSGGSTSSGAGGSGSTASTGSAGKPAGTGGSAGAPAVGSSGAPGAGGAPTGAAGLGQAPTAGAHG